MATALSRAIVSVMLGLGGLLAFAACRSTEPPRTPVGACIRHCEEVAKDQCSPAECERGCEFILDRLVEREMKNVVACVERRRRRCTDVVWAECATHVGPHADGGPPGPPPPSDDD